MPVPPPAAVSPPDPAPVETLAPGVRRILAPNPSPMTYHGTNTYLLGSRALTLIDPGPDSAPHMAAILGALEPGQSLARILVTHAHLDHSALAPRLSQATGAPVLAFGDALAGRSARMQALAAAGLAGGGEGVDTGFRPDRRLIDGQQIETDTDPITALWTPGHMANHLSFAWRDAVFSGDVVMGWASSLVSPPDGDVTAFLQSCARLAKLDAATFHPGHGAPIADPAARCHELIAHRQSREAQILAALSATPQTVPALVRAVYQDLPAPLARAAGRNVLAHLIALCDTARAQAQPDLAHDATFTSAPASAKNP